MPAKTTVEINPTNGTSTDFSFGDISFKLADMAGAKEKTFEYKIEESGTVAGVVNDSKTHTVSVKVTDDGKGKLVAVNTYTDGDKTNNEKAEFVNTYGADGTYQLKGVKTLTGRAFAEGDKWTFTVTAEAGTPMPAKTEVVIEPKSGTTADIDFGTITYSQAHAGNTYTYTVTETGTIAGVTNDPVNVKTVKVKVEDD
jgi:pilin isopeptide linkage protein